MGNRKHDIEKYLKGELSPAEMHALEKAALSDPFLAEALEGIEQAGTEEFLHDLNSISRSVLDRSRKKNRKDRIVPLWGWPATVAATIFLIAISGFVVVHLLREQAGRRETIVDSEQPTAGDTLSPDTTGHLALSEKRTAEKPLIHDQQRTSTRSDAKPSAPQGKTQEQPPPTEELALAESIDTPAAELPPDVQPAPSIETTPSAEEHREQEITDDKKRKALAVLEKDDTAQKLAGRVAGVTISEAPVSSTKKHITVRGKVTDKRGEELPGVNVIVKGTSKGTVSDMNGRYEIEVPDTNGQLLFAFIGFATKEITVGDQSELNVALEEDKATLSEVVVIGYGSQTQGFFSPEKTAPEPQGGRREFKNYLERSVKYPQEAVGKKIEGRVIVRFTVEPDGQLTNFEIVKGIGAGCEEELIRAIQQGPTWKPGSIDDTPSTERVTVRYKFSLPK